MSKNEQRLSYETIKEWVLSAYFDGCRDLAVGEQRPHKEILGYVVYQFENSFERPIENLMLSVVQLVLSGGWYPDLEQHARQWISGQLAEHGLESLLYGVPEDEAESFKHDLHILKLI
jgi:hypothetical protein